MKSVLLTTTFALLVQAGAAWAEPSYWRVINVAADDTLNVRAAPAAHSADIGDLPPDAAGIEIAGTDETGKWGRIVWQEGNGWIAMRFLAPDPQPTIAGTDLPAGLLCGGTEPFWSVRLASSSASYSDITGAALTMTLTSARVAEGRPAFPVQLSMGGPASAGIAIVDPQFCSDGMSDRDYPWTLSFLLSTASGDRFLSGCCNLPLEIGSN